MLTFAVYGPPKPQARPRMTKTGHVYTPADSSDYRARVRNAAAIAMQGDGMITDPCCLFVVITVQAKRTGWKRGEREWMDAGGLISHSKKPDADNVLKQIADACNGVVWRDDSQVAFAHAVKLCGREPRCDVWVWPASKLFWTRESISSFVMNLKSGVE